MTQLEAFGTEHDVAELGAPVWYYLVHCIRGTSGYLYTHVYNCILIIRYVLYICMHTYDYMRMWITYSPSHL